jgi:hypothetical protein
MMVSAQMPRPNIWITYSVMTLPLLPWRTAALQNALTLLSTSIPASFSDFRVSFSMSVNADEQTSTLLTAQNPTNPCIVVRLLISFSNGTLWTNLHLQCLRGDILSSEKCVLVCVCVCVCVCVSVCVDIDSLTEKPLVQTLFAE